MVTKSMSGLLIYERLEIMFACDIRQPNAEYDHLDFI